MNLKEELQKLAGEVQLDEALLNAMVALVESAKAQAVMDSEAAITESLKAELPQAISEAKQAYEAELNAQAETAIREFVAEHKEKFVSADEYQRMTSLVESLRNAFTEAGLGIDLTEAKAANAEVATLKEELAAARKQLEEASCKAYLTQALNEAALSEMQRDKLTRVLSYTSPSNLQEFKLVVDQLISEAKASNDDDDVKKQDKPAEPKQPATVKESLIDAVLKSRSII